MERASGSVSEICFWRGVHGDFQHLVPAHPRSRAEAILSFSRADLA
jgi:hypothetical protein